MTTSVTKSYTDESIRGTSQISYIVAAESLYCIRRLQHSTVDAFRLDSTYMYILYYRVLWFDVGVHTRLMGREVGGPISLCTTQIYPRNVIILGIIIIAVVIIFRSSADNTKDIVLWTVKRHIAPGNSRADLRSFPTRTRWPQTFRTTLVSI